MGSLVSNVGDLPQLSGAANSMSGLDMQVVNITGSVVEPGYARVYINTTDGAVAGALIYSVSIIERNRNFLEFSHVYSIFHNEYHSTTIEWNNGIVEISMKIHFFFQFELFITVTNNGTDTSRSSQITLPIPGTYVPDSVKVNGMARTDALYDDRTSVQDNILDSFLPSTDQDAESNTMTLGGSSQVSLQLEIPDGSYIVSTITTSGFGVTTLTGGVNYKNIWTLDLVINTLCSNASV